MSTWSTAPTPRSRRFPSWPARRWWPAVVDGRNIWRTDLEVGAGQAGQLAGVGSAAVAVSTSCSTLHVPYSLEPETGLDDALRSWLAFGAEKVHEVVTLARALKDGRDAVADEIAESNAAVASRKKDPRLNNEQVRARLDSIAQSGGTERGPAAKRRAGADGSAAPAAAADDHDRLVPADRRDPQGPRRAGRR